MAVKAIAYFYKYLARFLADMACTFMPFGGIYLMSTVIYSTEFMIAEGTEGRATFIKEF